jgi:citrate synthase
MSAGDKLSVTTPDDILVRGRPLAGELIGNVSFTEMMLLDLTGELPSPQHVRVVDAVLVAIMEHGITPSTLAARLVLDGAPEAMQGAVAAGLLATGSRFLGTIEDAARLLEAIVADAGPGGDLAGAAARQVDALVSARRRVPGMGHNLHRDVDPRVHALLAIAEREGTAGRHAEALGELAAAARSRVSHGLVLNAAGAVAALLCDLGHGSSRARGFTLVARCAGLFAHVVDERERPVARAIWQNAHEHEETS